MTLRPAAVLLVALLACKGMEQKDEPPPQKGSPQQAKPDCQRGEVKSCSCSSGRRGVRECDSRGTWQACDCLESALPPSPTSEEQVLAADGLPETIPEPSSPPPTAAEWAAVPREVTVRGSSALRCKTFMKREWLKVDCHRNAFGAPKAVTLKPDRGVQAYQSVRDGELASVVLQVVRSRRSTATYRFARGARTLVVDWPHGAPRPSLQF